jgi:hypothetical protein
MNYLNKLNIKWIIAIIVMIISIVSIVLQNRQETEEMRSTYEQTISQYKSGKSSDSISLYVLKTKYDSIVNTTHVTKDIDVDTKITKKGEYTYIVVTETTKPDGTITRETKTIKIDTTTLISKRIKAIIDSMETELSKKTSTEIIKYVEKHDTIYKNIDKIVTKKETTYVKITNPPKKMELTAYTGVGVDGTFTVKPIIEANALYEFSSPFYVSGGVVYEGNPIQYSDPNNYKLNAGVGYRFKF